MVAIPNQCKFVRNLIVTLLTSATICSCFAGGYWQVQYKGKISTTIIRASGTVQTSSLWNMTDWQSTAGSGLASGKGVVAKAEGTVNVRFCWVTNDNTPPPARLNILVQSGGSGGGGECLVNNAFESRAGSPSVSLSGKYLVSRSGGAVYEYAFPISSITNGTSFSLQDHLIQATVVLSASEDARSVSVSMADVALHTKKLETQNISQYVFPYSNTPNDGGTYSQSLVQPVVFDSTSTTSQMTVDRALPYGKYYPNGSIGEGFVSYLTYIPTASGPNQSGSNYRIASAGKGDSIQETLPLVVSGRITRWDPLSLTVRYLNPVLEIPDAAVASIRPEDAALHESIKFPTSGRTDIRLNLP